MKKPAPKPKAAKAAAKKPPSPKAAEHRIAVTSVGLAVAYGRGRAETFELHGAATVNADSGEASVRTTGFVAFASGKGANQIAYTPASLGRNLVVRVHADVADLALLRDVFVTGTGSEASDPSLTVWVKTARPLRTDAPDDQPVVEFGFRLDFARGAGA